ncbi:patatin-like phospholipase family protein [Rhodococcus sp. IEGM 1351]|uniref:patatin-like phospholipase family protein n=1 Tax=Rhodococcus sp. IEGM 1351 TaxID=3047089 RepID=UPI0024B7A489|nr:patatin-like phospholipase family protein [Rhodococcus sp. IEGM 1351]MDI9939193.1 patatin-like phospholipase family protein [Rhodococcus sp. IEGM 1351]
MTASGNSKEADLVLAGGGVKGIGLVGAASALIDARYTFHRVSGTSAGAVVGAILAAATASGKHVTGEQLKKLTHLNYREFLDPGLLENIPIVGQSWALLRGTGLYRGDRVRQWIKDTLASLGVSTFGDLQIDDDTLPLNQRYRLVVTVTDVTTGQLVRLPWDFERVYGLDPDAQSVADAVRASMAIPFFFRPVSLTSAAGMTSTLVDGGVLSNFPIDSLDRTDGQVPRWPTFGVTVLPNLPAGNDDVIPHLRLLRLLGPPHLFESVLSTMLVGRDQAYLNQPWVSVRAIRVDSTDVGVLDFDLRQEDIEALHRNGYEAAQAFLSTWNWESYVRRFRPMPPG